MAGSLQWDSDQSSNMYTVPTQFSEISDWRSKLIDIIYNKYNNNIIYLVRLHTLPSFTEPIGLRSFSTTFAFARMSECHV